MCFWIRDPIPVLIYSNIISLSIYIYAVLWAIRLYTVYLLHNAPGAHIIYMEGPLLLLLLDFMGFPLEFASKGGKFLPDSPRWQRADLEVTAKAEFGHGTDPIWLPAGSALKVSDPPSHKALLGSTTSLPCTFSLGKSPIDHSVLSIIWTFRDKEILRYNKGRTLSQAGLSLDVQAIEEGRVSLSVSNVTVSDEGTYTCVSLFLLFYNFTAVPVVTISRSRANLRCSVSGFYPMDIGVTWLRDGEPIPHSSNIDIRTWSNADGTYTLSNSLSVAPGGGQREGTYSCQVEHKSLPEPLLKDLQLVYRGETHSTNRCPISNPLFTLEDNNVLLQERSGDIPQRPLWRPYFSPCCSLEPG
uniref:Tapasin-related protein n=1 Tax=Xenopus tropicalis TaxID=8364 RepID=F6QNT7_XENTR